MYLQKNLEKRILPLNIGSLCTKTDRSVSKLAPCIGNPSHSLIVSQGASSRYINGFSAVDERISLGASWTGTDGDMATGIALGCVSALADARVHTGIADTGLVVWTFGVDLAFTTLTADEGVADISWEASADWTFLASPIVAWSTLRVQTAGIRLAEVSGFERSAIGEGVSGHISGTGADRSQATKVTVSIGSAGILAGVHAFVVVAGRLVARTLRVSCALRLAVVVGIPDVAFGALADGSVVHNRVALSVDSAVVARANALEVGANLLVVALGVTLALMSAAGDSITLITRQAGTDGYVVSHVTFSIRSTRAWVAGFLWIQNAATSERIACIVRWAAAYRQVVTNVTISAGSTRTLTRIDAMVVLASLETATFRVIQTLGPYTLEEWIARVSGKAGADGSNAAHGALCVDSAGAALAVGLVHIVSETASVVVVRVVVSPLCLHGWL